MDTGLFKEVDGPDPTLTLNPIVTNLTIKHTSAFNCERDSGMSKFQQIQFVEALKKMIIGNLLLHCDGCVLMRKYRRSGADVSRFQRLGRQHFAQEYDWSYILQCGGTHCDVAGAPCWESDVDCAQSER